MAENRVQIVITTDNRGAVTGIRQVGSELDRMGGSGANSVSSLDRGFTSLSGTLKATLSLVMGFTAALAGGLELTAFARDLVHTATALDTMNNKLKFAVGKEEAARSLQFLREESRRLGLDMMTAADSLGSFSAAARGTSMDVQTIRQVFLAVAEASTVMGLSNEEAKGAMTALSQIMSKGKVQAEELRGQLGERLPGAFQIAARAMNMTTSELDKLMSDGKLIASDFLPKFAAQLRSELAGSVKDAGNSTRSELNRLSNAWLDLKQAMLDAGFLSTITEALQALAAGARSGAAAIKSLKETTKDWPIGIFDILRPGGIPGAIGQYVGRKARDTFFPQPSQGPVRRPIQVPEIIGQYKYDPEEAFYAGLKGAQGRAAQFLDDLGKWAESAKEKTKPAWQELRENLAKTDQALAYGKMTTEEAGNAYKKYWQDYAKTAKPKGAASGASPIDIEAIDRDILQFREKMQKLYSELEDLDSEYRIARLEQSGRFYDAEAERLDRQAAKRKEAFAKEVADAEQAYLEMEQKLSGGRGGTAEAWAQLAELKSKWDAAKKAAQEYGDKIDRNLQLTKDVKKAEDDAKRAEDLAQLNLEYGKLTGTLQEQLALQILLLRAEKDRKLLAADPALRAAVERNYAAMEKELIIERSGSFWDNFFLAAEKYKRTLPAIGQMGKSAFETLVRGIESASDALAQFTMTGEMDFENFSNSILRDILRMQYQALLTQMILGSAGSASGGGGILGWIMDLFKGGGMTTASGRYWDSSMNFYEHHSGGIAGGSGSSTRNAPAWLLSRAPRLHDGLAPDEFPAILQRGERVLSRRETREYGAANRAPEVVVNVQNKTNTPVTAEKTRAAFDGKRYVVDVILDDYSRGGDVWKMIRGNRNG